MYVIPGSDPTVGLINLLANPAAASKQLQDLVDATNKHQEALDKLLNEQKKQRTVEAVKADYEDKLKEIEWERQSFVKSNTDLADKQSTLSSKQEELNQRISQFNKYLEDTKASMNDREKTLSEREKTIESSLSKVQSENAIASALRKSLEEKHKKISQIIHDPS